MNLFLQQLQQAWYSLQKRPGLLINMVSTIGLTLGALICALTLIYFMNFKPLAYANHQNLYHLTLDWFDDVKQLQSQGLTHEQSEYLFKNRTEQLGVALIYNITDIITSLEEQPSVETNYVTDNWFDLLSAELVLGSLPQSDSSLTDHSPTALISYELWQSYFSGDINVLDQTITIRGVNHRIVGVMSKYFQDPEIFDIGREVDVWLNWNHNWSKQMGWNDWQNVEEAIRVLALSSPENVANQLAMLNVQLGDAWQAQVENNGSYNQWSVQLEATSLQTAIYGDQNMLVYMVALACLGVFIICIANTTNLLLSRTIEKHYHLSIQAALGAKPRHIRQLVFAEIFLIMMLTLPVSLLVSSLGFDVIRHNLTSLLPRTNEMSLNGFNVLVSVLLLLLVSIIFTYFCARIINYRELRSALASSGKGVGAQVSQRTRNNLIVSQVTIASLLIFANSILFLRAYQEVTSPPTLAMDDRWQLRLTAKNPAELNRETLREALFEMKLAFEQHPSIAKVSQSLSPLIWSGTFPFTMVDTNQSLAPQSKFIDENYFSVLANQCYMATILHESKSEIEPMSLL